ncbi:MAG: NAD-dependent epimerase/dehydratase family protein [Chitinophagales bacterium]
MHIAITGANGFIGNRLCHYLEQQGHEVQRWQRKAASGAVFYDLTSTKMPSLEGIEMLIHTAFEPFDSRHPQSFEHNVEATRQLFRHCQNHRVKFVFLSSMSAHPEALSKYGKHKWLLQQELGDAAVVIRPGLVIGEAGLFQRISNAVDRLPVQLLIAGGLQPLQVVAVQELVAAIEKISLKADSGVYTVANSKVYSMRDFITQVGAWKGKKVRFFSVSYPVVFALLRVIEALPFQVGITNENLLGLKQLRAEPTASTLNLFNIKLSSLEEILAR